MFYYKDIVDIFSFFLGTLLRLSNTDEYGIHTPLKMVPISTMGSASRKKWKKIKELVMTTNEHL